MAVLTEQEDTRNASAAERSSSSTGEQEEAIIDEAADSGSNSWFPALRWVRTSMKALEEAEKLLFRLVQATVEGRFVPVRFAQSQIWTVTIRKKESKPDGRIPLVMIHGFGGGVGLWTQNFDTLVEHGRTVHAFDLLGFGRSSRPKFSTDATLAEMEWIQSIEDWRKEMGLNKMILLGHSLGGFLASSYALEYPNRVRHLILVDPWGFPAKPPDNERQITVPTWVRTVARVMSIFNPLSSLRAAGPWGKSLIRRFRPDLGKKFSSHESGLIDEEAIYSYIYHCNAQPPSGETAFKNITIPFGWAKRPMIERIAQLRADVPVSFVYGGRSWVDSGPGYEMQHQLRPNTYVNVEIIKGAGHHVYADQQEDFNEVVRGICEEVDEGTDKV